jgi:hypothetical protein
MNSLDSARALSFARNQTKTVVRVNYRSWLGKLVAWDGIVPIVVLLAPIVVGQLFPNRPGALEFTAVSVPIVAFFIRFYVAKRQIYDNRCSNLVRFIQIISLCLAIVLLLLIDTMIILAQQMPPGAMFATMEDIIVWAILISCYSVLMAFSMFPGRTEHLVEVQWPDVDPPRRR